MNSVGHVQSSPPTLLLGGAGQLGLALCHLLDKEALWLPRREEADLLNPGQMVNLVELLKPWLIINAAAYTQVDLAQSEPELAYQINAQSVTALAEAARRTGALLVHFLPIMSSMAAEKTVLGGKRTGRPLLMSMD